MDTKHMSFTILALVLIFGTFGCAGTTKLDTASGRPEISFQSVHVNIDDLSSALVNHYLDRGYKIKKRNSAQLVLKSPLKESSMSNYKLELTFNFVETRNRLRIVSQVKKLSFGFFGSSVSEDYNVSPTSAIGKKIYEDLKNLKDRMVDEDAFKGIKEEK